MAIRETVGILRMYLQDDGETLERRNGPQAVTVVEDLHEVMETRLQEESAYASLWDEFEADPLAMEEELIGALEALAEADPALHVRMESFLVDYQEAATPPSSELEREPVTEPVGYEEEDIHTSSDYSERGAYLRGNLRPGGATPEAGPTTMEPVEEGDVAAEATSPAVEEIGALFEPLYGLIDREVPDAPTRSALRAELEQMETILADPDEEYEHGIRQRLDEVKRLSPAIYVAVLERMAGPQADGLPSLQQMAEQMRETFAEEELGGE